MPRDKRGEPVVGPDVDSTKSENDRKQYRYVTLGNGLECLLISAENAGVQSGNSGNGSGSSAAQSTRQTLKKRESSRKSAGAGDLSTVVGTKATKGSKRSTRLFGEPAKDADSEVEDEGDVELENRPLSLGKLKAKTKSQKLLGGSMSKLDGRPVSLTSLTGVPGFSGLGASGLAAVSNNVARKSERRRMVELRDSALVRSSGSLVDPRSRVSLTEGKECCSRHSRGKHTSVSSAISCGELSSMKLPVLVESPEGSPVIDPRLSSNRIAAVSMSVGVGSFSEPDSCQGLAHFLEHMLFMGSSKYPLENEFDMFLSQNGGSSNAYTDAERTVYYFSCFQKDLAKALDIFAQFFIAPLLLGDAVDRELKSIESEFSLRQNVDDCRLFEVWRYTARKGTPFAKFCCGNEKTLKEDPAEMQVDIYEELRKFHEKYYIAPNMRLVVVGYGSLDALQETVADLFGEISDGNEVGRECVYNPTIAPFGAPWRLGDPAVAAKMEELGIWEKLLSPDVCDLSHTLSASSLSSSLEPASPGLDGVALGQLFIVPPVSDLHKINLTWQLPPQKENYQFYACEYVGDLIGHESVGSILWVLKRRGWATSLQASCSAMVGGFEDNTSCSLFGIEIQLTQQGLHHWALVVGVVFEYIGMLKRAGPQKRFFDENKILEKIKFRFKEEEEYVDYAVDLSVKMLPQWGLNKMWLLNSFSFVEWEPEIINDILNHMRPELLRIDLRSRWLWPSHSSYNSRSMTTLLNLAGKGRQDFEPYTKTSFQVHPLSSRAKLMWNRLLDGELSLTLSDDQTTPLPVDKVEGHTPSIGLPPPNPYLPTDFSLLTERSSLNRVSSKNTRRSGESESLTGRHVLLQQFKSQSTFAFPKQDNAVLDSFFGRKLILNDYLRSSIKPGKAIWADGYIVDHILGSDRMLIGYGFGLFSWHKISSQSRDLVLKLSKSGTSSGSIILDDHKKLKLVDGGNSGASLQRGSVFQKTATGIPPQPIFFEDGSNPGSLIPRKSKDRKGGGMRPSKMNRLLRALRLSGPSTVGKGELRNHSILASSCAAITDDDLSAEEHEELWDSFPACTTDPFEFSIPALAPGSSDHIKVWFMADKINRIPRTECYVRILSPLPTLVPIFTALNDFLGTLVFEALRHESYLAFLAELEMDIDTSEEGLTIHVSGFSEKLPMFLNEVVGAFVRLAKTSKRFGSVEATLESEMEPLNSTDSQDPKESISRRGSDLLGSFVADGPSNYLLGLNEKAFFAQLETLFQGYTNDASHFQTEGQLSSALYKILVNGSWHPDALAESSNLISTCFDVADFAALLLRRCRVEALLCGNTDIDQAERVFHMLQDHLKSLQSQPLPENLIPKLNILQVPESRVNPDTRDPWHCVTGLVHPLEALEFEGHSVDLYFQLGPDTLHNRLLAETIEHFMSEPLYTELRTRQQVGYMVECSTNSVLGTLGFLIEVTSNSHAPHELARIVDEFLLQFRELLASIDVKAFHESVSAIARTKIDTGMGIKQEAESLWESIALHRYRSPPSYEWKSSLDEIEGLRNWISSKKVLAAYDRWLNPHSEERRRVSVLVFGTSFHGDAVKELSSRRKYVTLVNSEFMFSTAACSPSECASIDEPPSQCSIQ